MCSFSSHYVWYQFLFTHFYFQMHTSQRNGCNRRYSGCLLKIGRHWKRWTKTHCGCLQQNVKELGYMLFLHGQLVLDIQSALMLTGGAKVDSSSTHQLWASSVNFSAEYPVLPDHDAMNNPSIFRNCFKKCCTRKPLFWVLLYKMP